MTKTEKNRQRVLNGGRGGEQAYRRLFEYYENKVYALNEKIAELEKQISILLLCKDCPDNKGGYICEKEYNDKCLSQKIQYIKELKEELTEAKDLICRIIRATWGEGWNYSLGVKVEAEKFLKECEE